MNRTPTASSEPHWTDSISNATLCNFFYIFFVIFTVWAIVGIIGGIWIFATTQMTGKFLVIFLFNLILTSGISITAALFHYLVCERALNPYQDSSNVSVRVETMSQYDTL
jgi:fatty-acid desaturase